jgi:hypothetical protein
MGKQPERKFRLNAAAGRFCSLVAMQVELAAEGRSAWKEFCEEYVDVATELPLWDDSASSWSGDELNDDFCVKMSQVKLDWDCTSLLPSTADPSDADGDESVAASTPKNASTSVPLVWIKVVPFDDLPWKGPAKERNGVANDSHEWTTMDRATASIARGGKFVSTSPWDVAQVRAASTARSYIAPSSEPQLARTREQIRTELLKNERKRAEEDRHRIEETWQSILEARRCRRRSCKAVPVKSLEGLRSGFPWQQDCSDVRAEKVTQLFSAVRSNFLASNILNVRRYCLSDEVHDMVLTPLGIEVQERFLEAWTEQGGPDTCICPTLHGTKKQNYDSIFAKGFLIPGQGNDLKVVHGSAHGLGIYSAKLDHASIAQGFSGGAGVLLCGVLDNAEALAVPTAIGSGRLRMTAESSSVRRVGGAIVVFDRRCIVPFFHVPNPKKTRGSRRCRRLRRLFRQHASTKPSKQRSCVMAPNSQPPPPLGVLHLARRAAQRRHGGRCLKRVVEPSAGAQVLVYMRKRMWLWSSGKLPRGTIWCNASHGELIMPNWQTS